MVRRHGWQLPAHTFQVVAITVFFLLGIAFYIFLAPFLWFRSLELAALALYSLLAVAVFVLYVRSSAIDPADLGIFSNQLRTNYSRKPSLSEGWNGGMNEPLRVLSPGISTPSRVSSAMPYDKNLELKSTDFKRSFFVQQSKKIEASLSTLSGLLCGWIAKDDDCRDGLTAQHSPVEEEVLFCTLCNAEVRRFSKHCRSCDKCVDGFDHHCRWLNNCVGRKNYTTFVFLMASSLTLLVLEWGLGMAVFVRCFADSVGIEHQIVHKLGDSFSRGPFATVVAICTLVSLFASIPLGELFFFHMILIRKGITTYEYVVAMRVQNEQQAQSVEFEALSGPASPSSSSGTALSGSSSVGLQYGRSGWCTPPRVFIDQQDEFVPHLDPVRLPSTVDLESVVASTKNDNSQRKNVVRISAWKLAKLNTDDVVRAAAKARGSSSVLRPQLSQNLGVLDMRHTSSTAVSSASSDSVEHLRSNRSLQVNSNKSSAQTSIYVSSSKERMQRGPSLGSDYKSTPQGLSTRVLSLNPLPAECRYGLSPSSRKLSFGSSVSKKGHERLNEDLGPSLSKALVAPQLGIESSQNSTDMSCTSRCRAISFDGYEASTGDSVYDAASFDGIRRMTEELVLTDQPCSKTERSLNSEFPGEHFTGYQQPMAGTMDCRRLAYVRGYRDQTSDSIDSPAALPDGHTASADRDISSQCRVQGIEWISYCPSSSGAVDNLVYSGTSIFYGGPISQYSAVAEERQERLSLRSQPLRDESVVRHPVTTPEKKAPRRSVARSQSPIFAPQFMVSSQKEFLRSNAES